MTVSPCPKCFEDVTVPAGAKPEARVRCPLCYEEYALSDALKKLPPSLIVLDDGAAGGQHKPGVAFSDGGDSAVVDERPPAFEFDEESAPKAGGRASVTPGGRPRKKPKNPLVEIAKIVGGGVVGIGAALMITIWFMGDPLKFGPKIGSVLPWIVPQQHRPNGDDADKPKDTSSNTAGNSGGGKTTVDDNANDRDRKTLLGAGDNAFAKGQDPQNGNAKTNDPKSASTGGNKPKTTDSGLPVSPFDGAGNSTNSGDNSNPPPDVPTPHKWIRGATAATPTELSDTIQGAKDAYAAWRDTDMSDDGAKRDAGNRLFESLASVGGVVTRVDPANEEVQTYAGQFQKELEGIAGSDELRRIITTLAAKSLVAEKRTTDGVALSGKVVEVAQRGALHEIRVAPEISEQIRTNFPELSEVSVFGWIAPHEQCKPGAEVLVLGSILDRPLENLKGYSGDADQIICGGFVYRRPSEPPPDPLDEP